MIKIDVFTSTRAEYGLMKPLLRRLNDDADIDMRLIVSGTHLSDNYGHTDWEIEQDGLPVYKRIPILSDATADGFISKTMANALVSFADHFSTDRPDFIIIDGDRYESLAVAIAAVNANIPIIHIGGGATTEGAADEYYRHAITKLSYLHFPSIEPYRKRIIQMGENPNRVFAVGSLGIESIMSTKVMSRDELQDSLKIKLNKPYAVATFHPVTLEDGTEVNQLEEILSAIEEINDMKFIFTAANADNNGHKINERLVEYAADNENVLFIESLGALRYYNALRYCEFVIGNSSSGIIEVSSFHIPTINIGDRQRGRLQAQSVLNCAPSKNEILNAIRKARSEDFRALCKTVVNPYGDGHTSNKMVEHIKACRNQIDIKKKFYDINF